MRELVRSLAAAIKGGLVLCLLWGPAWADTVKLTAQLAPVVPTVKSGAGSAALVLDTATKTVSWTIDYSGIAAPAMGAFMVAGPGPVAPLLITLPENTASPIAGSMQLTDPQIAGIQSGSWWVMLGSKEGPEIGGAINKAP